MSTEAQFQPVVTACHDAGVKVYVDTVIKGPQRNNLMSCS
jgi:hypothetical protein